MTGSKHVDVFKTDSLEVSAYKFYQGVDLPKSIIPKFSGAISHVNITCAVQNGVPESIGF